jgi:hypothetical protein
MKILLTFGLLISLLISGCGLDNHISQHEDEPTTGDTSYPSPPPPNITPPPPPVPFETLSKSHTITMTLNDRDLVSRLTNTLGGPSYKAVYLQGGFPVTQASLVTGYDKRNCSMYASALVSMGFPYPVDPKNVKERDMFGTKILAIYGIGGVFSMECVKSLPSLTQRADSISADDLSQIFGSLITLKITP